MLRNPFRKLTALALSGSRPAHASSVPAALVALAAALSAALVAISVAVAQTSPALPEPETQARSPWAKGPLSRVRLLAHARAGEILMAGVEIELDGQAHTYWRTPGDGGVPPQFDFSRSSNLRSATPLWPAPERFTNSGMDTFGYKSRVIFPIMAQPANSDTPVRLRLTLDYAACEKICVPGKAELELEIDPRRPAPRAAARIAQFAARAPQPMQGPQAPALTLEPGATEKSWLARVAPPITPPPVSAGFKADLFIEGPDGWFFDTKPRGEGLFEIVLAEKPAGASQLPEVTVTVTDPAGAFERKATLPASGHP